MEYEDRVTIQTPEGLDLQLSLGGVGSRFTAALVDFLIQNAIVFAAAFALVGAGVLTDIDGGIGLGVATFSVVLFLVIFGYDILFEVFAAGRTPGKRLAGLRVVRSGGEPVGFLTSAVRNLLRLVDFLPFMYAVGMVCILVTSRNQRLGDLAAGTLVVRERHAAARRAPVPRPTVAEQDAFATWDVSAVTPDDLVAVRSYLERRPELDAAAGADVAWALATRLRPKVAGAPRNLDDHAFLAGVAAAKAARR